MDKFKEKVIKWTEKNFFGDNDIRVSKDAKRAVRRFSKQDLKKNQNEIERKDKSN